MLILQQIHQENGLNQGIFPQYLLSNYIFLNLQVLNPFIVQELCSKAKSGLEKARDQFSILASKIPANQYFRFNDHWRFVVQRYAFLVTLLFFLESEKLALHSDVAKLLGGT